MSGVIQALIGSLSGVVKTYATWNPSDKGTSITLSNGNLTATQASGGTNYTVRSTIGKASGKWYWEVTCGSTNNVIGVASASAALNSSYLGKDTYGLGYACGESAVFKNSANVASVASATTNDIIGVAMDCNSGTVAFYKNNVLQATLSGSNVPSGTLYAAWSGDFSALCSGTVDFGATALAYTPPSGYAAGLY